MRTTKTLIAYFIILFTHLAVFPTNGHLEQEFIKEYGPDLGRQMFKQRFADPMAATTGGADPTSNLMMAHYGNYLKEQGLPIPEHSYEYPFPIGGRYAAGNMKQYDKMIMQG